MDFLRLKERLDHLYGTYDFKERLLNDPIEFPHRYQRHEDIEAAGLIASAFAFGRVSRFRPVIERLLEVLSPSPSRALRDIRPGKYPEELLTVHYRFYSGEDTLLFILVLGELLRRHGSIEKAFTHGYDGGNVRSAIAGFAASAIETGEELRKEHPAPFSGKTRGFRFFFPSPAGGGPCKRMNLFLRWMVRKKDIDFGIWDFISPALLVIPLDTHIARIGTCLGLTTRKSRDWKMAEEITESLRRLDPEDPLRYDFALCHQGITGLCTSACSRNGPEGCPVFRGEEAEVWT